MSPAPSPGAPPTIPVAPVVPTMIAVTACVTASAVVLLGTSTVTDAQVLAGSVIGAVSVPAGVSLLLLRPVVASARRTSLVLFALALVGYGVGQVVNSIGLATGTRTFPGPGDLMGAAVVPLLLVGFAVAPVASRTALPITRLLIDGALIGTAAALCLWELVVPERLQEGPHVPALVSVVLGLGIAGTLPLLAAIRDGGPRLLVVAVSVVLFVAVDLLSSVSEMGVLLPPGLIVGGLALQVLLPVPMALAARAWAREPAEVLDPLAVDTDGRTALATSSTAGALLVLVLLAGGVQMLDPAALAMAVTVVVLVFGREVLLVATQRRLLDRLTRQVMVDPLTGLHSALALRQTTSAAVAGVVVLDIAGLDKINQLYGRAVGDELVQQVAAEVRTAAPRACAVYRMGGDELAVVCPVGEPSDPLDLAVRLRAAVAARVDVGGTGHGPRVAVGVARASGGQAPLSTVLEDAVASLHTAQRNRSSVPVVHDRAQTAVRHRRLELEHRLPAAVAEGRITVLAQPVVDLATRRVVGVEALARWDDARLGTVSPTEFVEAAEHIGLIDELGEHVLRTAVDSHRGSGLLARGVRLSVNVSPSQLRSARLVELVEEVVGRSGMAPRQLVLEVTETVLLDEDGPALEHLNDLVALGAGLAIDDFGAGHASLGYLRRVPAHVLKLDRSLVATAAEDPKARALLQASLELCSGLGLTSVVEGVETTDVGDDMTRLGADLGQGWLWCPAVEFAQVAALPDRLPDLPCRPGVGVDFPAPRA